MNELSLQNFSALCVCTIALSFSVFFLSAHSHLPSSSEFSLRLAGRSGLVVHKVMMMVYGSGCRSFIAMFFFLVEEIDQEGTYKLCIFVRFFFFFTHARRQRRIYISDEQEEE